MSQPLPPRLLAALLAVASRLDLAGVEWLLAGGAGRALLGFAGRPNDLDLEISPHSEPAAPDALGLRMRYEEGGGRASWRAQGRFAGAALDLTSELEVRGHGGLLRPDFTLQRTWAHSREIGGHRVWLAPVEETVARALVEGDWGTLGRVAQEGAGAARPTPLRPAYLALRLAGAARTNSTTA